MAGTLSPFPSKSWELHKKGDSISQCKTLPPFPLRSLNCLPLPLPLSMVPKCQISGTATMFPGEKEGERMTKSANWLLFLWRR